MKKGLLFLLILLLPSLSSCQNKKDLVKVFISSNQEVDYGKIKEQFPNYNLEISYANPESYYYPFLFKSSREKDYDIFIIRDEEYVASDIENIYVPFDAENIKYLDSTKTYDFYELNEKQYGIKLNTGDYKINSLTSFEDGHDYYINLAKMSRYVGSYSIYQSTSYLAFEFLNELL